MVRSVLAYNADGTLPQARVGQSPQRTSHQRINQPEAPDAIDSCLVSGTSLRMTQRVLRRGNKALTKFEHPERTGLARYSE
jgi:hypothetical protein